MQKVIYLLWRHSQTSIDTFSRTLRSETSGQLVALGAHQLRLNVADDEVAPAAGLRQENDRPLPDATLALWIDSANRELRQPFDEVLGTVTSRLAAYLVCESVPMRNSRFLAEAGKRTHGFAQMAFLTRPPRLTHEAWLDVWQNHHTRVAIDTQDNFEYVQNLVVQVLSHGAAPLSAIVEECFPPAAMIDPLAFFDAPGDQAKFQRNLDAMMDSCNRFIDFDRIDVLPTSQYPL